jgi:hypothetical protein
MHAISRLTRYVQPRASKSALVLSSGDTAPDVLWPLRGWLKPLCFLYTYIIPGFSQPQASGLPGPRPASHHTSGAWQCYMFCGVVHAQSFAACAARHQVAWCRHVHMRQDEPV